MLDDFADVACMGARTRDQSVKDMGRVYGLAEERDVDGVVRWRIDYEVD